MPPAPDARGREPAIWGRRGAYGVPPRAAPGDLPLLRLLAALPLLWPGALAALTGARSSARLYARLARLRRAGLVAGGRPAVWPFRWAGASGTPRLLFLTGAGAAVVRGAGAGRQGRPAHRSGPPPAGRGHRVAAYALLAWLTRRRPETGRLVAWRAPWRHRDPRTGRTVTLPAGAALGRRDGRSPTRPTAAASYVFLLLPDLGTAPVAAFRARLAALTAAVRAPEAGGAVGVPELVVGTASDSRARAWCDLLGEVADARGVAPLPASVVTWQEVLGRPPGGAATPPRALPAGIGLRRGAVDAGDRLLLDLVGRHPFLEAGDLAAVLGWAPAAVRGRRDALLAGGLLRLLDPAEAGGPVAGGAELLELTRKGVAFVAAQQGLTVAEAVRHNGLVGGGPDQRWGARLSRARYVLLRHLAHTRGADGFFVALARAARLTRRRPAAQGDAALVVWRNAIACARGRLRPDGYGVLRLAGRRHGFFLEYDRGTQDAAAYRRKLAAYYAYRDSGAFAADYAGFPTVLLVTTDTDAENRIAGYAGAAAARAAPLAVLLTSEWRYGGAPGRPPDPEGALGPIWRSPAAAARRRWPGA